MSALLLDTCILIDYLRGKPEAVSFLDNLNQPPTLSTLTVAELYAGVREGQERTLLDVFVQKSHLIPLTPIIAKRGGLYRRDYGKSHGVGIVDALIASTAEEINAQLVTLNQKHFPMLSDLVIPY